MAKSRRIATRNREPAYTGFRGRSLAPETNREWQERRRAQRERSILHRLARLLPF